VIQKRAEEVPPDPPEAIDPNPRRRSQKPPVSVADESSKGVTVCVSPGRGSQSGRWQ
jgi:hypothetical protein